MKINKDKIRFNALVFLAMMFKIPYLFFKYLYDILDKEVDRMEMKLDIDELLGGEPK